MAINQGNQLMLIKSMLFLLTVMSANAYSQQNFKEVDSPYQADNTQKFEFNSKVLNRSYDIHVKLPKGYSNKENQHKHYPVLYLNDAPYTFKVALGVTHFPKMDKAIIVAIGFAHGEHGQHSRVRDLTPENDPTWRKYETGGAPQYLKFIESEVIPFVEDVYRIDSSKRILSGQSLGGSFGSWVLVTRPALFSSYILTSPSHWFKNDMIFALEASYAKDHQDLPANVFYATGAVETPEYERKPMVKGQIDFVKALRARDYPQLNMKDEIVEGTDHFSTFPVGLTKGLRWLYQDVWQVE